MGTKLVFTVTNFGTRVGVPVSEDCNVEQFKKAFESVHFEVYPGHGKLRVDSVEIKWKSFLYRVCDSLPVELVLDGEDQCLHIMASKSEKRKVLKKRKKKREGIVLKSSEEKEEEKRNAAKSSSLCRGEKRIRTSFDDSDHQRQGVHDANLELQGHLSETVSKTISVTGIINKYFSTCDDEVNSYSSPSVTLFPIVPEALQLHDEPKRTRVGVPKKTSVGARVIEASQRFGISSTKKSHAYHLSKLIDGGSTARMLVFD